METFTVAKPLVEHPDFAVQKDSVLSSLNILSLDEPVWGVVTALNDLSFCFTMQSCYGHFVFGNREPTNLEPLPLTEVAGSIEYRIAYVALCVQKCEPAVRFLDEMSRIPQIDPKYSIRIGGLVLGSARQFLRDPSRAGKILSKRHRPDNLSRSKAHRKTDTRRFYSYSRFGEIMFRFNVGCDVSHQFKRNEWGLPSK